MTDDDIAAAMERAATRLRAGGPAQRLTLMPSRPARAADPRPTIVFAPLGASEEGHSAMAGISRDGPEHTSSEHFWERHYRRQEKHGSIEPNPILAEVVRPLTPGTALDLGCGQGSDAIRLALNGWRVTAVDVSVFALDLAAERAAAADVANRIDWQRHELAHTFPVGSFDLVSAQYLQSPVEFSRDRVLQAAARTVAPGGLLLIVDHGAVRAPWAWKLDPETHIPTPEEILAALDLTPRHWRTEVIASPERQAAGPNGQFATVTDNVVAIRRLPQRSGDRALEAGLRSG